MDPGVTYPPVHHALGLNLWSDRYPATQNACDNLAATLSTLRPQHAELVADDRPYGDRGALWSFDR